MHKPMNRLPPSTLRRLKQLPQIPNSIWEGDRLDLNAKVRDASSPEGFHRANCILWVDGIEQTVRSIEAVPVSDGPEAFVRALLKAMESPLDMPQAPMPQMRPEKVVVRDRELHFFLRGVLQDLDITVEYHHQLPLLDEMIPGLQHLMGLEEDDLSDELCDLIEEKAMQLWETAPWKELQDHQILSVTIQAFDLEPFYLSVMGNLGMEYGVLLYRSVESLKQFRAAILRNQGENMVQMQEAFLQQDCLFLNYELEEDNAWLDAPFPLRALRPEEPLDRDIDLEVGSINPLEGVREQLDEEEAIALVAALEAIHRFFRKHRRSLRDGDFPECASKFRITIPEAVRLSGMGATVSVQIATLPDLTDDLWAMVEQVESEASPLSLVNFPGAALSSHEPWGTVPNPMVIPPSSNPKAIIQFKDDLVPVNSMTFIGRMDWETYELLQVLPGKLQQKAKGKIARKGDGFPVFVIQTSRPKAKAIIEQVNAAGGVQGIGFCPLHDAEGLQMIELTFVKTQNGELNIINDYEPDDPDHQDLKSRWARYIKASQGHCGFVVAIGVTGATKGQLDSQTMIALYETQVLTPQEIGIVIE